MTGDKIKDFTLRVTRANKTEMIVILYDIATVYINDAIAALDESNLPKFREELNHVRATVNELMNSLNTSTELGRNLLHLYLYANGELTHAYLDYAKDPLYHVLGIFNKLNEAYRELAKRDTSGSVMENAEKVYTGFTYNKNSMAEDLTAADSSRGYLV